jgi:aminomethyltransferase
MGTEGDWEVPLSYDGAAEEVLRVRTRAGVMDLSHVGRVRIRGDGALDLLERVCASDVAHQEDNTALYTLLCNDRGGIIDRCRLLRLEDYWVLLASPIARTKVLAHLESQAGAMGAKVDDQTDKTVMIAVAGPAAPNVLDAVLPEKASMLPAGAVKTGSLLIAKYIVVRGGDTGEWGLEVIIPRMAAGLAWDFITKKAGANAVAPVGMVARDVLRIEAGLPAYGQELNETIDPVTAGLESAVSGRGDFLGAEAVAAIRRSGVSRGRVGLVLEADAGGEALPTGTYIPRQGDAVTTPDGREVGSVTSGTYSPTLEKIIAMAYVAPDAAAAGTELAVHTGAERRKAKVVGLPFYRTSGPV